MLILNRGIEKDQIAKILAAYRAMRMRVGAHQNDDGTFDIVLLLEAA